MIHPFFVYLSCPPWLPHGGEVVLPDPTSGLVATQVIGAEADVLDHQLLGPPIAGWFIYIDTMG